MRFCPSIKTGVCERIRCSPLNPVKTARPIVLCLLTVPARRLPSACIMFSVAVVVCKRYIPVSNTQCERFFLRCSHMCSRTRARACVCLSFTTTYEILILGIITFSTYIMICVLNENREKKKRHQKTQLIVQSQRSLCKTSNPKHQLTSR